MLYTFLPAAFALAVSVSAAPAAVPGSPWDHAPPNGAGSWPSGAPGGFHGPPSASGPPAGFPGRPSASVSATVVPSATALPFSVQLGPRPFYLVDNMTDSALKTKLQSCSNGPFEVTGFSIGHRGGGDLQIPEESVESEHAGERMGAGILECDVSFTKDRGLVCRHSLCDLHTTTDILTRPALAAKCTVPFTPANASSPANALCCTSDITTAEYMTLCSKMDAFNSSARTPQAYLGVAPTWRTELYDTCAKPMTLNSYIDLVDAMVPQRNFTPELKTPPAQVPMPFNGYTQQQYAQDMISAFVKKNISSDRVWAQSFLIDDIIFWLKNDHAFGKQAVYLIEADTTADINAFTANLTTYKAMGINIIGPAIPDLIMIGGPNNNTVVPTPFAMAAKAAGLDMIAWTFERSGPLATVKARGEYYFNTVADIMHTDGQYYEVLDVMVQQIGIKGMFSDWSSTITYYANCFGLKGPQNIYT